MTIRGRLAYPTNGNKSHSGDCSGAFHRQEIPDKSKQTEGGPVLALHLQFRKGRGFIYRNFRRAAHGEARAELRVFPCA